MKKVFTTNEPYILELFSGSKVVSATFEKKGFKTFSVDNNPKLNPDLCIDILQLTKSHLPGQPLFIWASPVCTHFSRACKSENWEKEKKSRIRFKYTPTNQNANNSILLLNKTIEILSFYPDTPFILENPVGRIIHFDSLQKTGHYRYYVNYFNFGFKYSKETFLFTNIFLPFQVKRKKVKAPSVRNQSGSFTRSKVPAQLIEFLIPFIPF